MDTKLKSTKKQSVIYVLYLLISIFSAITFLSLLTIKSSIGYIFPEHIYKNSMLASEIDDFTGMTLDYAIYYKNDEYVNDKNNITDFEIDSYKKQIEKQIELEYQEYKSIRESSQSFNELNYDKQQEILIEERKDIEKKYAVEDEKVTDKILELKKNAYENLIVELNSYNNIEFAAYDKLNDLWIGSNKIKEEDIKNNSKYYAMRKITAKNGIVENIFINGKQAYNKELLNRINRVDSGYYSVGNYVSSYTQNQSEKYYYSSKYDIELYIWIPKDLVVGDSIYNAYENINESINNIYIKGIFLLVSLAALIILIFVLKKVDKNNKNNKVDIIIEKIKNWPIEYKLGILLFVYFFGSITISPSYYSEYFMQYSYYYEAEDVLSLMVIFITVYFIIKALIINYKEGTLLKNNITLKVIDTIKEIMARGSIIKNIFLSIAIYGVIGFALLFLALISNGVLFPICFAAGIIMTIALIILAIKKLLYLDKIMVGAKLGAEGKLSGDIEEKGTGLFTELAHDINNMKDGLRKSIKNEMKSERMKSELITNVSHDLKTPLTSIINYIDLLKREDLEAEIARDYVRILDSKSQRLKILIEDLFEASKAASGEMKLNIERIDVVQLLKQTLGEYDEKLKACSLEVKVNMADDKIYINGDGKRLFRVFENLISNITKYSLKNTRVYIDVINNNEEVVITMKNISLYELNFDSEDITNRFKRGDEARTTEGSGLGLAIAKSIVELHNGEFTIEIDGDLFKSTIKLACI